MQQDFREELRARTREDHDRVDMAMSGLDLTTQSGLSTFLGVHYACFSDMMQTSWPGSDVWQSLNLMTSAIETDLAQLDQPGIVQLGGDLEPVDPLALDYIIEGSRLGTQVLRRRWSASRDPVVTSASAYFTLPGEPGKWRSVCAELSEVDARSPRARDIIDGTRRIFALFLDQLSRLAPPTAELRDMTYAKP